MDLQALEKIGEIIGSLGGQAQEAFILFLSFEGIKFIIHYGLMVVLIVFTARIAREIILALSNNSTLASFRDQLGIGSSGELIPRERRETIKMINKLIQKHVEST